MVIIKTPSLIIEVDAYKKLLLDLKAKGIKLRYITDITKDNIQYVKELLKFATDAGSIIVEADRARIIQVISNLLSNALKFTKKEEGGSIYVTAEEKENHGSKRQEVIVSVKDNGKGINPEILPRLFTKFATKSETGTGLGLFICKCIIEVHGGRIWAENNNEETKKGAILAFSLPT